MEKFTVIPQNTGGANIKQPQISKPQLSIPNTYPLLGQLPPGSLQGQSVLIIDGAYLQVGARDIEKQTSRKLVLNESSIKSLLSFIQSRTGGLPLTQRHFVTAEKDSQSIAIRQPIYDSLKKNSISVDIRGFKKKQAWCPNKNCPHSQKAFDLQMQSEVDVAIVMKAMKIAFSNQLEQLVLIAGDGDFKDMVEFFTETLYKKVWVFGYKSSLSASLHEKASPNCVFFLDEIWENISMPMQKDTNVAMSMHELRKPIEKLIWSPEIEGKGTGISHRLSCSCSQESGEPCSDLKCIKRQHQERQKLLREQVEAQNLRDFQLMTKLGFDDDLAREALQKHPGDPQNAIKYAIEVRKMRQSQM